MMRNSTTRVVCLILILTLSFTTPGRAGILDTLAGVFSGGESTVSSMFGGSDSGNSGDSSDLTSLLDQLEQSQKEVSDKQNALSSIYNGSTSAINPQDASLQQKLNDLQTVSRTNESLYLRLLQTRADLAKNNKDLGSLKDRVTKLTTTQNQLESNYQKIQETNKNAGLMKPPADSFAQSETDTDTDTDGEVWRNPEAQKYIDEYLSLVHLNRYGQWEGQTGSAIVKSAGSMDASVGRNRFEFLWNVLSRDTCHSNMTMEEFVNARLRGESPQVVYTPPESTSPPRPAPSTPPGGQTPSALQPGTSDLPVVNSGAPAAPSTEVDVSSLDAKIRNATDQLVHLQKTGKGDSDEAKAVLKNLKVLQSQRVSVIRKLQEGR